MTWTITLGWFHLMIATHCLAFALGIGIGLMIVARLPND